MMIMMMATSVRNHPKEAMHQSTTVYQGHLEIISLIDLLCLEKCCVKRILDKLNNSTCAKKITKKNLWIQHIRILIK